jgi:hypothetical protein
MKENTHRRMWIAIGRRIAEHRTEVMPGVTLASELCRLNTLSVIVKSGVSVGQGLSSTPEVVGELRP